MSHIPIPEVYKPLIKAVLLNSADELEQRGWSAEAFFDGARAQRVDIAASYKAWLEVTTTVAQECLDPDCGLIVSVADMGGETGVCPNCAHTNVRRVRVVPEEA